MQVFWPIAVTMLITEVMPTDWTFADGSGATPVQAALAAVLSVKVISKVPRCAVASTVRASSMQKHARVPCSMHGLICVAPVNQPERNIQRNPAFPASGQLVLPNSCCKHYQQQQHYPSKHGALFTSCRQLFASSMSTASAALYCRLAANFVPKLGKRWLLPLVNWLARRVLPRITAALAKVLPRLARHVGKLIPKLTMLVATVAN
jgi:hypothetical protein